MKKIIFRMMAFTVLVFPVVANAQAPTFRFSYDIGAFDIAGGMVQTPAGEFVYAGLNNSFGPYYGNAMKIDAQGNVVWAKSYNAGFATAINDIKNVSTGGFICTGQSTSGGGGAILIRLDAAGNVMWANRYQLPNIGSGNASSEWGTAVIETSDGGFLVGGGVDYFWDGVSGTTVDTTSALGFKVNSTGGLLWNHVWPITVANPDEHYINDVAESADGYYFVGQSSEGTGTLSSNGDYPSQGLIIKTNLAGTTQFLRRFGATGSSQGLNCALRLSITTPGNILLGGFDDVHAMMFSINGTGSGTPVVAFNRRINGSAFGSIYLLQDIMENADGNFSWIGTRLVFGFPTFTFYSVIGKINSGSGAWMFGKGYTPIGLSSILPEGGLCSDQGYFLTNTDQQMTGFNANIIRTDATGLVSNQSAGCQGTAFTPTLQAYSVTWSTPTSGDFTTLVGSSMTITVNNQTPVINQHCLNVPAVLSATSSQTNVLCRNACTGTATATPAGGTAPYTYSWNSAPVQTTQTATGLCAGSYTCTVTDNVGATTTVTVNITQPATVVSSNISSSTNLTCNGVCTGAATVSASGGTAGYTYSWSPSGGTGTTASSLCATNYTVTVTDANGCTTTSSVSITQPTAVTATATSTPSSCSGSTGTATASPSGGTGGYTYSWNPSGQTTATATNLAPGPYVVTVTDANGCTTTANVTVSTTSGPTASLQSSSNVSCFGGTNGTAAVNVSGGSPGYTYSWAPSGGTASSASGLGAGNYTCTVTDQAGCVTTQTVAITQPTQLTATASSSQTGCTNTGSATANPSGGTAAYTYSWSPSGGTGQTENNLGVGSYTCIVTDANSCTTSVTASVTLGTPITVGVSATSSTVCAGTTTTLTATGATNYNWQPGGQTTTTIVVTPSSSTTYTLIGTDGTNCADTTTFLVTVNPTPTVGVLASPPSICQGDSVQIGAAGATSYLWLPGNQTTSSISDFPSATTTYTIIGTDASGCSDTTTVTVVVNSTPTITASASTDTSCTGAAVTLTGTGATTYDWNPGNLSGSSVTVNPTSNTTYTVIGLNGVCADTTTIDIAVMPGPAISVTSANDTICQGSSSTMTASGAVSYVWSSGGTNASETVSPSATSTYTVTGSDANGCTSTATFAVVVNIPAAINITGTNTICTGNTTTLTANGGVSYVWSTSATSTSITVNPTSSQTYSVVGTDVNGCTNSTTFSVTVVPPPTAGVSGNTNACPGSPVTLTATGGGTYTWSTGGTTSTEVVTPSATTTYSVIVSNGTCSDTASITVTVGAGPAANAGNDTTINYGNSAQLNGSGGGTYSWTPAGTLNNATSATPVATPSVTTTYTVVVTDTNGCTATDSVTVFVDFDCGTIFVPNIFSPNFDQHNDELQVYGTLCVENFHWAIYDRWGELVFETTNPNEKWDGTYKGKMLDPAVFVYRLTYTELTTGDAKEAHGNVTLVK